MHQALTQHSTAPAHARPSRWWRAAALLWLVVVVCVAAHQWRFWQQGRVDTNVLALLPINEHAPDVAQATQQLSDQLSRQLVVMIGTPQWQSTRTAAQSFQQHLASASPLLQPAETAQSATMQSALDFYQPWRQALLTPEQRQALRQASDAQLVQQAVQSLYQPAVQARLGDWVSDPLGLWTQWWAARAAQSQARPRDGVLWVQADGMHWQVLQYELKGSAFKLSGEPQIGAALQAALAQARADTPQVQTLLAGVPLHAEVAAVQAHGEINTIGWGSLIGVLLLAWLAFRSTRPVLLVGLSLVVGCAVALSVTSWWFGQVHLLTLVFGASLVGVAEDYGIHYFAARQGEPEQAPQHLMRKLMPALWLALVTSVIAYVALGMAAFPGLRQMALFSVVGLAAAMVTVMCWFPWLDTGRVPQSRIASRIGNTLNAWPRWRHAAWGTAAACALVMTAVYASGALRLQDDVRQLQNASPELVAQQLQVSQYMGLPSPAQFYLVQGSTAEEVLQREEHLTQKLQMLVVDKHIAGYSAVSDWVPSAQQQSDDTALVRHAQSVVLTGVNMQLGESFTLPAPTAVKPLVVEDWLDQPISAAARALWLGEREGVFRSLVMLRGVSSIDALAVLAQTAQSLEGVKWVDKPAEISSLLQRYRISMTQLLVLGHVLVLLALCWRFGRQAWRAWLPTVLASVLVVGLMALLGMPWQLFNVLALMLLLGVGIDYGIFLQEHEDDAHAWLAVVIGAGSTWLSFGLLGMSQTPALRAFGSTLMFGLPLVLVLAPLYRAPVKARKVKA